MVGPSPPEAQEYNNELADYLLSHYQRFARSQELPPQRRHGLHVDADDDSESDHERAPDTMDRGRLRFTADVQELLACFNGCVWQDRCQHHCSGPQCCRDAKHTAKRLSDAASRVLFRSAPGTPAANKWAKLGPALDWVLSGMAIHNLLLSCMLQLRLGANAAQEEESRDVDLALQSELSFAAIQGKRWKVATEFLSAPANVTQMFFLAFALEPMRFIPAWWMRRAREVDDSDRTPMLDILHEEHSPLMRATQYVSSFLLGRNPRLMLHWRRSHSDYDNWCRDCPREVRMCRRLLLVFAAALFRRHAQVYSSMPWCLLRLADTRTPAETALQIQDAFDDSAWLDGRGRAWRLPRLGVHLLQTLLGLLQ